MNEYDIIDIKYKTIFSEIVKCSFDIKCEMLFLVFVLKENKCNLYKLPVLNYSSKQYDMIKYLNKYIIKCDDDLMYCNFQIKIARGYLRVLYFYFLDMYYLKNRRINDNYEGLLRKRFHNKIKFYKSHVKDLDSKYNKILSMFKDIFHLIDIVINFNNSYLNNMNYIDLNKYEIML